MGIHKYVAFSHYPFCVMENGGASERSPEILKNYISEIFMEV